MWNLLIPAVTSIIDKIIPDPQAAAAAKLKVIEMQQAGEFKHMDAILQMEQELTKRSVADAASDSWLAKNIRPLVMIYLLTLISLIGFDVISVGDSFLQMVKAFTEYGLMFYFGGRTIEKITSTISDSFGTSKGKGK